MTVERSQFEVCLLVFLLQVAEVQFSDREVSPVSESSLVQPPALLPCVTVTPHILQVRHHTVEDRGVIEVFEMMKTTHASHMLP